MFMLVSGYLFSCSLDCSRWDKLLLRKARQLLIPLLCWSALLLGIDCCRVLTGMSSDPLTLPWAARKLASGFIYGPWFLWAIWWCSLAVILVRKFFRDSVPGYLLCTALTFVIPDILNLALYKYMWPYFLLGHLFRTHDCRANGKNAGRAGKPVSVYSSFSSFCYASTTQIPTSIHRGIRSSAKTPWGRSPLICTVLPWV